MSVTEMNRQKEYDYILKQSENCERKPVDRWFYDYCVKYRLLCERVGGVESDASRN